MRNVETPRLVLEPQVAAHAAEMYAVLTDPSLYQYENEPPRSEAWLAERYQRLASRRSPDGAEHWLNWVLRLRTSGRLIGYVQATVTDAGQALIAYELNSTFWGQGLAREAVEAMLGELVRNYRISVAVAVFKQANTPLPDVLAAAGFQAGIR